MSNWRADFPAINNHLEWIYLDNAATMQKPQCVIARRLDYEQNGRTALGRSSGQIPSEQNQLYQQAKLHVEQAFGMKKDELIITPSATGAANLLAINLNLFTQDDCPGVALANSNHSSLLAPFFSLEKNHQAKITLIPVDKTGKVDLGKLAPLLTNETIRLIALSSVSNVLGINENISHLGKMITQANKKRQRRLFFALDAAASVSESEINFTRFAGDFIILSAHKMGGPMLGGLGVKKQLLQQSLFLPNLLGGGNVEFCPQQQTYQMVKDKSKLFNAGVFDLASLLEWETVCQYWQKERTQKLSYLHQLTASLVTGLNKISGITILGEGERGHIVSFIYQPYHCQDVMAYLALNGVCAREGQHCAQLLHQQLGLEGSIRFSLAIYNQPREITQVLQLLTNLPRVIQAPT